ncbi:MAG: energy transducer TonB [Muribaculaceae bacterium]|nr:energy transducer TonB [Muribaculaceae bacterium]
MAKDVDLSSQEWRDLIFEGKNKEFGAYTLRSESPKRHSIAIIVILALLAIPVIYIILSMFLRVFDKAQEADVNAANQQKAVTLSEEEMEEEEVEDIPFEEPEVEEEPQIEEEVTATQAVTEILIVEEVDKDKEVKVVDMTDTRQVGAEDVKGVEDATKEAVKTEVLPEAPKPVEVKKDEGPVSMAVVEQKPSFPGGDAAMYSWLSQNIVYPAAASEEGISGKVTVQFIVEKDGRVSHVHVVRGKHPALDAEALRVVKKMPKWTPGRNNGQPVRVTYNLPVTFRLQ